MLGYKNKHTDAAHSHNMPWIMFHRSIVVIPLPQKKICRGLERVMVFNTTFSNISVISWLSVLMVEETGVHREYQQTVEGHWQTLSLNVLNAPRHERDSNSQL
jgi:hypothetical protein